jgi:hypothetical protein
MLKTAGVLLLAVLLMLAIVVAFTAIGTAIVAAVAWLLTSIAPLTFPQAALVVGATALIVAYISQRKLAMGVIETGLLVLVMTPLTSLCLAGLAWGLNHLAPLDFWQAMLLVTAVGLGVFYLFTQQVGDVVSFNKRDEEESDEEEDWDEEEDEYGDWDEGDWDGDEEEDEEGDGTSPSSRLSDRRPQARPEAELELPVVGPNESCPCGSGKKYKYCHGRRSR